MCQACAREMYAGWSALMFAADEGKTECVARLAKAGCALNLMSQVIFSCALDDSQGMNSFCQTGRANCTDVRHGQVA